MTYAKKSTLWTTAAPAAGATLLLLFFLLPAPAHAALTDGLVGYWTLNGKDTNWATGVVTDSSGQGNNGSLINMSTTTSPILGKVGQALKFVGASTRDVSTLVPSQLNTKASNMTFSIWVNRANNNDHGAFYKIGNAADASGGDGIAFGVGDSGAARDLANAGNQILILYEKLRWIETGVNYPSNGTWHLFTLVINASGFPTLYQDGVQIYTDSIGAPQGIGTIGTPISQVGGYTSSVPSNRFFTGKLDDVHVYNRALSAAEVVQLYKAGVAKFNVSPTNSLTQGLVGYWTFDGKDTNWSTGRTNDLSGQGNNGSLISMSTTTTPVVGKIGQGLKFDGVNDKVAMGNPAALDLTTTFSICTWIKPSGFGGASKGRILEKDTAGTGGYIFSVDNLNVANGLAVSVNSGSFGTTHVAVANAVTLNVWQYVCATVNSTAVVFYVNGQQFGTGTLSEAAVTTTDNFFIGDNNANTRQFMGSIDDVRIYNRALSQQEITQLYKLGAAKFAVSPVNSLTQGLVGYWTFDGKNTNWATGITNDLSGQGNNGSIISMSTTTSPTPGKVGSALKFNGTTQYVVGSSGVTASPLTMCGWFKYTSGGVSFGDLSNTGSTWDGWYITGSNSSWTFSAVNSQNFSTGSIGAAPRTGQWDFVCGVVNNDSNRVVYVNGVAGTTDTSTETPSLGSQKLGVGASVRGGLTDNYFTGSIDDVRIYNRALSAAEITQLYRLGVSTSR